MSKSSGAEYPITKFPLARISGAAVWSLTHYTARVKAIEKETVQEQHSGEVAALHLSPWLTTARWSLALRP